MGAKEDAAAVLRYETRHAIPHVRETVNGKQMSPVQDSESPLTTHFTRLPSPAV